MSLVIQPLVVSPFMENCYLAACSETGEAVVVDPGDEAERILETLTLQGWTPKFLIATHAHVDHVSAVAELQERAHLDFYLHPGEEPVLQGLLPSQAFYGFGDGKTPHVTHWLEEGQRYFVGNLEFTIIETPGHSPGGVCLNFGSQVFTGDTLFRAGVGRADLPGGDFATLMRSIKERLLTLPLTTTLYPDHGGPTTVGLEMQTNPWLV